MQIAIRVRRAWCLRMPSGSGLVSPGNLRASVDHSVMTGVHRMTRSARAGTVSDSRRDERLSMSVLAWTRNAAMLRDRAVLNGRVVGSDWSGVGRLQAAIGGRIMGSCCCTVTLQVPSRNRPRFDPHPFCSGADWQLKPHCRPSEVANGPFADAAIPMRRGRPVSGLCPGGHGRGDTSTRKPTRRSFR